MATATPIKLPSIFDHLSTSELELLCHPHYKKKKSITHENARRWRNQIAESVARTYQNGSDDTIKDDWRAKHFADKITIEPKQARFSDEIADLKARNYTYLSTDYPYWMHVRFVTHVRLLFTRIRRTADLRGRGFLTNSTIANNLGLFAIAGFTFDLIVVLKTTFSRTLTPYEAKHPKLNKSYRARAWQRFKNLMQKGNRPYRMINDFIWSVINGTVFVLFLLGATSLKLATRWLNGIGFGLDLAHELFWLIWDAKYKYKPLIGKLNEKLKDETISSEDYKTLQHMIKSMHKKDIKHILKKAYTTFCVALVFAGMTMFYVSVAGNIALTGSVLALVCGSMIFGIGYVTVTEYFRDLLKMILTETTADALLTTLNAPFKAFRQKLYSAFNITNIAPTPTPTPTPTPASAKAATPSSTAKVNTAIPSTSTTNTPAPSELDIDREDTPAPARDAHEHEHNESTTPTESATSTQADQTPRPRSGSVPPCPEQSTTTPLSPTPRRVHPSSPLNHLPSS